MTPAEQRIYADGVLDGMEMTLRLALGEAAKGGTPYRGRRPRRLRAWARAALARIEEQRP